MKRITFCANFCNLCTSAKQSDSDAKHPLCLALSNVYHFTLLLFFVRAMIDITRRCFANNNLA